MIEGAEQWLARVKIGVIGLGYVGLPVAVEFAKRYPVVGFDVREDRIAALSAGHDETREVGPDELAVARGLRLSADPGDLRGCDVYIVTVPTPIDEHKRPDLGAILAASETVGRALEPGGLVIFESTVYPGCTEEDCVPVIERASGLRFNADFTVGYSPERISPGDREHRLPTIRKIVAGSTPAAADKVDALYRSVVTAGTYRADSIRIAEAAKVIENTQRDVNIALVNELAIIFNRMGIDTQAVLEAAGTKWNFLPFRPGLVGGHCIGVDPYYLTHKAEAVGYHPDVILAGRRINDGMGAYVATEVVKLMARKRISFERARLLVLGLSFKENCPDLRNSRVVDLVRGLQEYGIEVDVHDPLADPGEIAKVCGFEPIAVPETGAYDGVVLAVAHDRFRDLSAATIRSWIKPGSGLIYDVKSLLPAGDVDARL